jgi:CIC family chloride channel protein
VREVMQSALPVAGEPVHRHTTTAFADDTLKVVVYRMASTGLTHLPVLERTTGDVVGVITLADLLHGRRLTLEAEHRRERVFTIPFWLRSDVMP